MEDLISELYTSEFQDGFRGRNVSYNQTKKKIKAQIPIPN